MAPKLFMKWQLIPQGPSLASPTQLSTIYLLSSY
ncbi:uncharacterized protein FFMR_08844 [Fusarium fujikuroi]|nr:uncharacterized protein FFMR_08844 [Fusarium fujikuroi]